MKRNLLSARMAAIAVQLCLIALIVMGFSGCVIVSLHELDTVAAKGDPEIYQLTVGKYSAIKVEGYLNIRYNAAASDTVTLSVPSNVREYYSVNVINDELVIRTTRRITFPDNARPVLTVSTPVLNRLTIEGAGTFTAQDKISSNSLNLTIRGACSGKAELDVASLSADISGAGKFELSGRAGAASLSLSGAGDLDALSLETREAKVNLSGAGTVRVNCLLNLDINASGVGTVVYRGSPSLSLHKSGMVSVRRVD